MLGTSGHVQLDESDSRIFKVSDAVVVRPESHPKTKGSFVEQGMPCF